MFAPTVLVALSKLAGRLAGPVAPPLGWLPLAAGRGPESVRTQGFGPQFDPEADHDTSGRVAGGSQSADGGGWLIFLPRECAGPLRRRRPLSLQGRGNRFAKRTRARARCTGGTPGRSLTLSPLRGSLPLPWREREDSEPLLSPSAAERVG